MFAAGETIVRQGAAGDSMFVVLSGRVRVSIEPSGQEVAVIPAGGFFGEMSMLTGDARTATVKAPTMRWCWRFQPRDFRALADANPALLDHVSTIVGTRRTGLEEARAHAAARRRAGSEAELPRAHAQVPDQLLTPTVDC